MIKSIRIKNFKSLRDTGNLDIKPITLLIGPNSSGKSSLIQFIILLKQTADSRLIESPILLNGDYIELESYKNIIYKHDTKNTLEFSFTLDKMEKRHERFFSGIKFYTKLSGVGRKIRVLQFKIINSDNHQRILSMKWDAKKRKYSLEGLFSNKIVKRVKKEIVVTKFYAYIFGIRLSYMDYFKNIENNVLKEEIDERWETYADIIENTKYLDTLLAEGIYYLGPLRKYPERHYPVTGATMKDVGFRGEKTIEILAHDKKLLKKVEYWMKIFGMANSVKICSLQRKKTLVELRLEDPKQLLSINLYDMGFGISQVLPIIVEGFYAPDNSLLIIEQPEIHLHPKLQAEMSDLLIEIAKNKKKLIVETHSEHLLLRLQRRVIEGKLKKDDIAIYFFKLTKKGTTIRRIEFDEIGNFKNWPAGLFEEDVKESFAITDALLKSKKYATNKIKGE